MKKIKNFSFYVADDGNMTIYNDDGDSVATISDCNGMTSEALEGLAKEVLQELDYEFV